MISEFWEIISNSRQKIYHGENMYNYKMTICYDGTKYNGWQKQGNTNNTIQEKLNEIIGRFTGEEAEVNGSGRTDKGVHAKGQVANVKLNIRYNEIEFTNSINSYLPQDIKVIKTELADLKFHARLSAKSKTYSYIIDNGDVMDVFSRKYSLYLPEKLDLDNMKKAADYMLGIHDFSCFCGNRNFKKSPVRTIDSIDITNNNDKIIITYSGNGFLQNMVRIMTGTLIETGQGIRTPESVAEVIHERNRDKAGFMAPPYGLFLMEVRY